MRSNLHGLSQGFSSAHWECVHVRTDWEKFASFFVRSGKNVLHLVDFIRNNWTFCTTNNYLVLFWPVQTINAQHWERNLSPFSGPCYIGRKNPVSGERFEAILASCFKIPFVQFLSKSDFNRCGVNVHNIWKWHRCHTFFAGYNLKGLSYFSLGYRTSKYNLTKSV